MMRSLGVAEDPGFGIYVHWPYCAAICPYCAFNVVRDRGDADARAALLDAILADLEGWRARTGPKHARSLYLGGGTPSRLDPSDVGRLIDASARLWNLPADAEITLEANPDDAAPERLAGFRAAGVNRLSLGVQALDDAALHDLGRWHSAVDARRAVDTALAAFDRVSIDLIAMRPGQTPSAWESELAAALATGVEHVSVYELTIEEGTAFERRVRRGSVPETDDARGAAFLAITDAVCAEAGFDSYETSNHARGRDAQSAHNLIYWRSGEWVGAGPGAHGRLGALGEGRRATAAAKTLDDYRAAVAATGWGVVEEEALDAQAQREETLLMGLRLAEGVPLARIGGAPTLAERLAALEAEGFLRCADGRLAATPKGRPLIDRLVLELATAGS
jgi:putative oxygen-independent coproporphyrinogen III oxidase